ncbi:MAG: hypothetical protein ACE5HT_10740 [Gemmatimonadales bacterium]
MATQAGLRWDVVRAMLLGLADSAANSIVDVVHACHQELGDDPIYLQLREIVTRHVERMCRELHG